MQIRRLIQQVLERLERALGEGRQRPPGGVHDRSHVPLPTPGSNKLPIPEVKSRSGHVDAIAFYLGLLGALALTAQVIGILTTTSFVLLALASLPATYAVFHIPPVRSLGLDYRSLWLRLMALLITTVLLLIAAYAVGRSALQSAGPSGPTGGSQAGSCIYPGSGFPEYRKAFQEAYDRKGGRKRLGCALDDAVQWGDGISQNFRGDDGESVIAAVTPDKAYVLTPEFHKCINSAVKGPETFPVAGYPYGDPARVNNGWEIMLGAGISGGKGKSAVYWQDGRQNCYWVKQEFWDKYQGSGGPNGRLGFPTGEVYIWQNRPRQDFEHGFLLI